MDGAKNRRDISDTLKKCGVMRIGEAVLKVKEFSFAKFDESVDIAVRLNVDPKKSGQSVRGVVLLPNGTGKSKKILAICSGGDEDMCLNAGADYAGGEDYLKKIEKGFLDFDIMITVPEMMIKIGRVAKILGPRGLMPNPKTGTVTTDIKKTIMDIKNGQIEYRCDRDGIIHSTIGRRSFENEKIVENVKCFISNVLRNRPQNVSGMGFIKSVSISSTMGPGFFVSIESIVGR